MRHHMKLSSTEFYSSGRKNLQNLATIVQAENLLIAMEGEITLSRESVNTANLRLMEDNTGEFPTPDASFNLDDDTKAPSSSCSSAAKLLSQGNPAASSSPRESSTLTRLRDSMFHRLKHTEFTQQELPAWKPILTPTHAMTIFMALTLVTVPIGIVTLAASHHVVEVVHRYDTECMNHSQTLGMDPVTYIQSSGLDHRCNVALVIPKFMHRPVLVFYELTRFHQNHRRYMKSRSIKQQEGEDVMNVASCHPIARVSGNEAIVPCGLMAWSLFNDTYEIRLRNSSSPGGSLGQPIPVLRTGIAWNSDVDVKFSSKVYPRNFPNNENFPSNESGNNTGIRRRRPFPVGGARLDPTVPLSRDENLMVWMRPAVMPRFRKLYGRMQQNLHEGQVVEVEIENVYNSYSFRGSKSLVLSTTSFLGGKNLFLGRAYLATGVVCMMMALVSFLVRVHRPRQLGDRSRLTWNCPHHHSHPLLL